MTGRAGRGGGGGREGGPVIHDTLVRRAGLDVNPRYQHGT